MSRRIIYLCYGKPASGKSMLTQHLDNNKVYVCGLMALSRKEVEKIDVKSQMLHALQKFFPQPIKGSDELKDGVEVVLFETCCIETKKFAEKILESAAKALPFEPGFVTVEFASKVMGDKKYEMFL